MTIIKPNWPAPNHIRAFTTTRLSWGSLETSTDDLAERARLHSIIPLPAEPVWLKQTHSTLAIPATPENIDQNADASFSAKPHQVCLVLTADCLPVLLCDKQGQHVAAIHAGWRGLANGVIENTVAAIDEKPEEMMAWLGPAIGPEKFEVGADVFHAFTDQNSSDTRAFKSISNDKWLANLYDLAKRRLNDLGITSIYGGDYCTYTQQDLFYSWRRDHNKTARLASMIWIEQFTQK